MKIFEVKETFHDYRLVHLATGLEACMGDGAGESGDPPGTERFRVNWEHEVNECAHVYFQAYFARLDDLEIYDTEGVYVDRYTVVTEHASQSECFLQDRENLWVCLALSDDCDNPGGFSQWGYVVLPNKMIGERVHFLELPVNVQKHLVERLEEDRDE